MCNYRKYVIEHYRHYLHIIKYSLSFLEKKTFILQYIGYPSPSVSPFGVTHGNNILLKSPIFTN